MGSNKWLSLNPSVIIASEIKTAWQYVGLTVSSECCVCAIAGTFLKTLKSSPRRKRGNKPRTYTLYVSSNSN